MISEAESATAALSTLDRLAAVQQRVIASRQQTDTAIAQIAQLESLRDDVISGSNQTEIADNSLDGMMALQQRVIATESGATVLPLSFVVVDESVVLLAVPGFRPGESGPLSNRTVLRHLVRIVQPEAVRAFIEVYEAAWADADARLQLV